MLQSFSREGHPRRVKRMSCIDLGVNSMFNMCGPILHFLGAPILLDFGSLVAISKYLLRNPNYLALDDTLKSLITSPSRLLGRRKVCHHSVFEYVPLQQELLVAWVLNSTSRGLGNDEGHAQAAVSSSSLHARDPVRLGIEDCGSERAIRRHGWISFGVHVNLFPKSTWTVRGATDPVLRAFLACLSSWVRASDTRNSSASRNREREGLCRVMGLCVPFKYGAEEKGFLVQRKQFNGLLLQQGSMVPLARTIVSFSWKWNIDIQ
ncbi:hypothetical protein ARMSODRAFT_980448 [Armillaria solidipes]|uniref:Uncharacterized protein n=1 Tax=Armillaria solidipes TaxID=1076256 RepID=A0A2H3B1M7_9AGAR|nr:hypothetical protein ARMSODRAFT_980448 [Armillaria solidipes]